MIPPYIEYVDNPTERMVYRYLQDAPDSWVVIHSLRIPKQRGRPEGEADFVILVPDHGVLVLEVKGGTPYRDEDGVWHLGKRSLGDGPLCQALRNMWSLIQDTKGRPSLRSVNFAAAVCLPDANDSDVEVFEWEPWEHVSIATILEDVRTALNESAGKRSNGKPQLSKSQQRTLVTRWKGPVYFHNSPGTESILIDQELKRLTAEQHRILRSFNENDRITVKGAAGSGKTMLAIEACRRAIHSGECVLFCCYNVLLGRRLVAEMASIDDEAANLLWVGTIHDYMLYVTDKNAPQGETAEFPERQDKAEFYDRYLPEACVDRLSGDHQMKLFDLLIVDEAQDILAKDLQFQNYLDALDLSVYGGLQEGRWIMFADLDQQSLYDVPSSDLEAHLSSRMPTARATARLSDNIRNRPSIAERVSQLVDADELWYESRRIDGEVGVDFIYYADRSEQIEALIAALRDAQREGIRDEDVVILHPSLQHPAVAHLKETGPKKWAKRIDSARANPEKSITHASIRRFKGMEARYVIVTDIDCPNISDYQQQLYTAMTRSTDRVVVIAHENSRHVLEPSA